MSHPFIRGEVYLKARVAAFLGGGNPQSGILYGAAQIRFVAIFVGGSHSTMSSYPDEWLAGGILRYCGQGSKGDQKMSGANSVVADPLRVVLLFERIKQKKGFALNRFIGEYVVTGYEFRLGKGVRSDDKLILFSLTPKA